MSKSELLLRAAEQLLREVGHEELTIRMVAQRADVSAATAYTYLGSKQLLFVELFYQALMGWRDEAVGDSRLTRIQHEFRSMGHHLAQTPQLAEAVTSALLGHEAGVAEMRLKIGAEFLRRLSVALGDEQAGDDQLLDTLQLCFSGALLQAGMGFMTYQQMGERLAQSAAEILRETP